MGELLSPVEAILQNILGADNILVPPGSQVEEILQAIYYNTEYENNPKSRVAEILLAIKNKGVYDGPVLSRVEDILVHKLNNIPYTKHKKEDLSRVEQLLLDWLEQGGGEEIIEYTGTFPMTILANGEPLLDYLISGNTVQSGTPTPDSPIIPQGTGERSAQLIPKYPARTKTLDGVNWDVSSNGKITGNGTTTSGTNFYLLSNSSIPLKAGTYTLSFVGRKNISLILRNITTMTTICAIWSTNSSATFTIDDDIPETDAINLYFNTSQIGISVDIDGYPMLNLGSTALPYIPYGYKIPISSASTTTPVYLGEVETTRKIKKLVLTGEEYVYVYTNADIAFRINTSDAFRNYRYCMCTHFTYQNTPGYSIIDGITAGAGDTNLYFTFSSSSAAQFGVIAGDTNSFKAYLAAQYAAGTPVTVWYVLANEETAVVNEPLMRIGNYADTLSYAQAGVDVPTNKKPTETVIDVPTSVKPSEGYIKYTEPTDGPTPKTQVLGTKNHEIYVTSNDEVYVLRR